ncbi:MAG: hypothetical protein JWO02_1554 [Solirubrobacterales bacterium]|nr:hypothetical protein [Solirubrobacterales bacterium]
MPDHTAIHPDTHTAIVRDAATRGTVAVGLAGIALIHVIDGVGKWSETRYLFWLFMGLIVSSLAVAGAVLFTGTRASLLAAAGLSASALVGYVLSRTTGLPNATGDIGNWGEPIGLANVVIEAAVILVAAPAALLAARGGAAVRTPAVHAARAVRASA